MKTIAPRGMRPAHKHDCDTCVFVGTILHDDGTKHDAWVHESNRYTDYIIRFGSDGPDYACGSDATTRVYSNTDGQVVFAATNIMYAWMHERWMAHRFNVREEK